MKTPRLINKVLRSSWRSVTMSPVVVRILIPVIIVGAMLVLTWPGTQPVQGAEWDTQTQARLEPAAGRPTIAPTDPAAPPLTPTNTPTPTPTPVPVPVENCAPWSVAAPADWPLATCETFDNNADDWPTGSDNQRGMGTTTRTIVDGAYTWEIEAYQDFWGGTIALKEPVTDFYVAVEAQRISGPVGETGYGVQFRHQDPDNFYMLLLSDLQEFKFYHLNQGQWIALIDWTQSAAIVPGESNRVGVKAVGPDFTFYINDQQVAQFSDDSISQGELKLATWVDPGEEARAVVDFDNFEVRLPPPPAGAATQ